MNKKLRLFVIISLVIQILLPLYLLYTHYSDHNYAMAESPTFKFRLESIDVYEIYDSGEGSERLDFHVLDLFQYYQDDIAVTVGADGYAQLSEVENKRLNKHWFTFKYCYSISQRNNGNYIYEAGVDIAALHRKINRIYRWDIEKPEGFYVTAKVYKGVFIPIAIYIEDQKVITFTQEIN